MKLYVTEPLNTNDVCKAACAAQMWTDNECQHGSRYADVFRVIEFNGYGSDEVASRRHPNERSRSGYWAATWDQWGVLLSILYTRDPSMRVGGYKRPVYRDAYDFHTSTGRRFEGITSLSELSDFHGDHTFRSTTPYVSRCTHCTAMRQWGHVVAAL